MRYVILIDSDPATGLYADLSEATRHGERTAAKHAHSEISIEGCPEGQGGPMATWRYDRDVALWVSTN